MFTTGFHKTAGKFVLKIEQVRDLWLHFVFPSIKHPSSYKPLPPENDKTKYKPNPILKTVKNECMK